MLYERLVHRPPVEEFSFHVFGRPLHPELFEVVAARDVERAGYFGRVAITTAGHFVTWRYGDVTITEVACPLGQPLPQRGRHAAYRLRGYRTEHITIGPSVHYRFTFQVEPIRFEVLEAFQEELWAAGVYQGLICQFDQPGNGRLPALSYANVVSRNRSMLVQVFHTFPDDWVIVKVESLFQIMLPAYSPSPRPPRSKP
ncbi:MAG: DUF2617 family protein [Thermoguttaceae bacterium]|nr:DUF2617 family protein [Thermoguttaceae bacterium]MDW8079493.1 DUF2617 family protein [Thermoguttaceae bacterium]